MSDVRKVFVTGAAGMIGSNIARHFVELGLDVVGVDSFWRGSKDNFADLANKSNFSFRHADIVSDRDWYRDLDGQSVLIHTADIVAGIGYVFANEWTVFQRNLLINTQVARVVNQYQPSRFVYLGTACSYPQKLQRSVSSSVLSEGDKFPADPESGYGWSKLIGEIEFRLAIKGNATRFTVLDLHNVYGWPCVYRDSTSQVIPSLIYKALRSTDGVLSVWGDGNQGRAFLHVRDVVSAVQAALIYGGNESAFMIGPGHCTPIGEVANLIKAHPEINITRIVFDTSKPIGDIGRFADSSLALRELKWQPNVNFRAGLHELIDKMMEQEGHGG
jgi:GDP-D-mannose 3',5'-epimerase